MNIHPTAVIDPSAEIGAGCEIGPYCIVGPGVVLGEGCWLQHHVSINGPSRIGRENKFYAFTSIGQRTQDLKYAGEPTYLEVGDHNTFRDL
jgi:UDP-N-acetylglucosamine acyltransferase